MERKLLANLVRAEDSPSSASRDESLHGTLVALEKLQDIRSTLSARNTLLSFFEKPAGIALLTGVLTITALQVPAYLQARSAEMTRLAEFQKPLIEVIAKDEQFDLDTRLILMSAIADERYRDYEFVTDLIAAGERDRRAWFDHGRSLR